VCHLLEVHRAPAAVFLKTANIKGNCGIQFTTPTSANLHCNLSNRSFVLDDETGKCRHFAISFHSSRTGNTADIHL